MRLPILPAIMKTIIYADIFDYPLTKDEIWKGLIECNNATMQQCNNVIKKIQSIKSKEEFCYIKGRDKLVSIREERKKYSAEKLSKAYELINKIKLIPSVKLIGITGALAMENGKKEDDIDLFIITSSGLLWTTRLLVTLLVEITGTRRHPQEINANNKICLNMFLDENHLEIPQKEQDLFSAHEVMQMKPLFDRNNTYQRFLSANQWVKKYLPNAIKIKNAIKTPRGWQAERSEAMTPPMVEELVKSFFNVLENFLKSFQLWYMRNRRTSEIIKEGIIRFHPQDARTWIMDRYSSKINTYVKQ